MRNELLDTIAPLLPTDFFSYTFDLSKKLKALPDLSELLAEDPFATLSAAWSDEGLTFLLKARIPFTHAAYPNYQEGDSLELFIDTRDTKDAGYATRFCHHFVILPQPIQDIHAQELTHFRSEDVHPLCDPALIQIDTAFGRSHYQLEIFLPTDALHGYDPSQCPRLGFSYRLNRPKAPAQHFTLSSTQYNIAQQPSLWATLNLKR